MQQHFTVYLCRKNINSAFLFGTLNGTAALHTVFILTFHLTILNDILAAFNVLQLQVTTDKTVIEYKI